MNTEYNVSQRLEHIDSLRGIAAILVVISHFIIPIIGEENTFALSHVFDVGKIGVSIFFMISGFVIPYSLTNKQTSLSRFFISRFFRLYPAYWVSLIIFLFSSLIVDEKVYPVNQIIANITMFQTALHFPDIVGAYWTLFIELIFYFLCVALFLFKKIDNNSFKFKTAIIFIVFAIVLSYIRWTTNRSLPVALPLALALMIFGGFWRETILNKNKEAKAFSRYLLLALILSIPIISYLAYGDVSGHAIRYTFTYYFSIAFFCILTTNFKITTTPIVALGAISYSMYIIHPSILIFVNHISKEASTSEQYLFGVLGVITTIPISYLVYSFIEKPGIKLGKRMINLRSV